jgi:hypothetical protein
MPGVHQRLVVVERATRLVDQHLKDGLSQLSTMVKDGFDSINREREDAAGKLFSFHSMMAASLGGDTTRGDTTRDGDGDVGSPPATRRTITNPPAAAHERRSSSPVSQHRLTIKFHSLNTLYNEWYGLGESLDFPVPGGIAALEASNKAKWRRHFSANEVKTFSRVKMIVCGIEALQYQTQRDMDVVIDEMDVIYAMEAKKSVASMAIIVQTMGLVSKKKSRGKTKV